MFVIYLSYHCTCGKGRWQPQDTGIAKGQTAAEKILIDLRVVIQEVRVK